MAAALPHRNERLENTPNRPRVRGQTANCERNVSEPTWRSASQFPGGPTKGHCRPSSIHMCTFYRGSAGLPQTRVRQWQL